MVEVIDKTLTPNKCQRPGCKGVYIESLGEVICNVCSRPPAPEVPKTNNAPTAAAVQKPTETQPQSLPNSNRPPGQVNSPSYLKIESKAADIIRDFNAGKTFKEIMTTYHLSVSAWASFKRRHGLTSQPAVQNHTPLLKKRKSVSKEKGTLPPFPAFSDTWPAETQIVWMDKYFEMWKSGRG